MRDIFNTVFILDPRVGNLLIGALLPLLVAAVVKRHEDSTTKWVVLMLLTALSSSLTSSLTGGRIGDLILTFLETLAAATLAHYGITKPLGVTGSSGAIAAALPGGIGSSVEVVDDYAAAEPVTVGPEDLVE